MTTQCQNIADDELPGWAMEVGNAIRAHDEDEVQRLVQRIRCGHDAFNVLIVLPHVAAYEVRAWLHRTHGPITPALTIPNTTDHPEPHAQLALQILAAAMNNDADNAAALAMTAAEPLMTSRTESDIEEAFTFYMKVLHRIVSAIQDAQGEGLRIRAQVVTDPTAVGL